MEARLILLDPPAARREVKLSLPATIGRSRDAKIKLVHGQVSRVHCEFFERDGVLHVRDLGSTNGTYVGDDRVGESAVPPGETVTIGAVKFRAEYEPAEDAVLPAVVLEPTATVRKTAEATFRGQLPEESPRAVERIEPQPSEQGAAGDTYVSPEPTVIPPVLPLAQKRGRQDAPPPLAAGESDSDTTATVPRPVEWDELEELALAPLEEDSVADRTEKPAVGDVLSPDDSLHIFPPSDEPASKSPPELQWRVPDPSPAAASGFAVHVEEPDLEPPEPLPNTPPKSAKNDDDSFEEFLRSLEDDERA